MVKIRQFRGIFPERKIREIVNDVRTATCDVTRADRFRFYSGDVNPSE